MRARHEAIFYPVAALLAMALLVFSSGLTRAADFDPRAQDAAQLPDTVHGPGADRIPPGLACRDEMDFSPEENMRSPFDADQVAALLHHEKARALPASDNGCPASRQRSDKV